MITEMMDAAFDKSVRYSGLPNAIAQSLHPKLHALAHKEISGDEVADMLIELCESQADIVRQNAQQWKK